MKKFIRWFGQSSISFGFWLLDKIGDVKHF